MISLTIDIAIIANILTLSILLWLIISRNKTRQTLNWWYTRQHMRMCQEAELIRNQTLQDLFVLRRSLELSQLKHYKDSSGHAIDEFSLNHLQKIHNSLIELSEYLYPAHIDDSLPLAVTSLVNSWKSRFPNLNLSLQLPEIWINQSEKSNRMILMAIEELLQVISSHISGISIFMKLSSDGSFNQLEIQIEYTTDSLRRCCYKEVDFICHLLPIFTNGKLSFHHRDLVDSLCFRWDDKVVNYSQENHENLNLSPHL